MCAILGGTNPDWDYTRALEVQNHRGPDGNRSIRYTDITLGFARLSIIDLDDRGMQPMESADKSVVICFNGEIYNYVELRDELIECGYFFRTTTDTEVVLNAYLEWEDDFLTHLDGMFGVSILDGKKKLLKLYRDRVGIKPLYYYEQNGEFAFSSELKGLVSLLNNTKLEIDNTAIYDFYNYLYIPAPKSMYKSIYQVEPAHAITYDLTKKKIISNNPYWFLNVNYKEGDCSASAEKIEELRELISKSVQDQMVADVPRGTFLSGGVDSSIITYEAMKVDKYLNSYSIGYYDYETSEIPYIDCLNEHFGFKSQKYYMKKEEFKEYYYELKNWCDEPLADTAAYPTYVLSREASKKSKVILMGDGGDEVFGGYQKYIDYSKWNKTSNSSDIDKQLKKIYELNLGGSLPDTEELKHKYCIDKDYDDLWYYRKYYDNDLPPTTRFQLIDLKTYLPSHVLAKSDRVTMANSIEGRVPLLSKEIVEYGFSLSQKERCGNDVLKKILKEAYSGVIPNNILYRRKAGFGIPWFFFGSKKLLQEEIIHDIWGFE